MSRSVVKFSRRVTLRAIGVGMVLALGAGASSAMALEPRDVVVADETGAVRAAVGPLAAAAATETPVMGASTLNAAQLATWFRSKGHTPKLPTVGNDVARLAQVFIDEGTADGVRGDLAFVQSAVETGWFTFPDYGQIRPEFNNFSGINAFGGRAKGTTCAAESSPSRCFATPELGARNQIQLLRSYADPNVPRSGRLKSAPSDRIGAAPLWEQFGYCPPGKLIWAGTCGYGGVIVSLYRGALTYNNVSLGCLGVSANNGNEGRGYWLATADGAVQSFGAARNHGSVSNDGSAVVGGRTARHARGYYLVTSSGAVHAFGPAAHYGDARARGLANVVGMERTTRGYGYWVATATGRVYAYGSARRLGSLERIGVDRADVVGVERSAGNGYWLYTADGTVYPFGDAADLGSLTPAQQAAGPVVGLARTPSGLGYWMLQRDGTVRSFGDARSFGDVDGCVASVRALLPTAEGDGYWILTGTGRVIPLGAAKRLGEPASLSASPAALIRF